MDGCMDCYMEGNMDGYMDGGGIDLTFLRLLLQVSWAANFFLGSSRFSRKCWEGLGKQVQPTKHRRFAGACRVCAGRRPCHKEWHTN